MRTLDEIRADAATEHTFSNATEWEIWSDKWCNQCVHDVSFQRTGEGDGCPLIYVALTGKRPAEWLPRPWETGEYFECVEYRDEDNDPGGGGWRPGPPAPIPDPLGQLTLLDREPYEGVRMYADVAAEARPIGVGQ